jgi:hypothetical protein
MRGAEELAVARDLAAGAAGDDDGNAGGRRVCAQPVDDAEAGRLAIHIDIDEGGSGVVTGCMRSP